jgi:hypothetical protein
MILLLSLTVVALMVGLFISVKKNLELLENLEEAVRQTEESLDLLDESYGKIYEKSKIEIFSDEPIVKELLNDINGAKDAVLLVANKLYKSSDQQTYI